MATKDLTVRILGDASNFNQALAGIGNSASVTGAKLTKNLTPAAAAVGVAMAKIGSSWNDARDAIIVGTGASGKALDGLIASSKKVAGTVPNDFGDVGKAIADVNTRLGLTGPELETVSKKALDLSRITGTDLSNNIRSSARVVRDWGLDATEAGAVMDMMFRASQNTGIGFDTLGDKVVQFGAPMRQFGFSMEESIALLAGFEQQGVNTETVMAGLRQGLARIARAGEDPIETFRRVTEEIKNAGSAGEANTLALEVFGARAGPDMAAAIREGRFEIDELVASLGSSEGSIDDAAEATLRFSDRMAMVRNRIIAALGPFGEIGGVIGGVVASLGPLLFGLGAMAPLLTKVKENAGKMGAALGVAAIVMAGFALHAKNVADSTAAVTHRFAELARASDDEILDQYNVAVGTALVLNKDLNTTIAQFAREQLGAAERVVAMAKAKGEETEYTKLLEAAIVAEIKARDNAASSTAAETSATEDNTDATEDNTDAVDDSTDAIKKNVDALEALKKAQDDARKAQEDHRNAVLEAIDTDLAYRNQTFETSDAISEYNDVLADGDSTMRDVADASRNAEKAILDQAAAALAQAEAQAASNDVTLTATQRNDIYVAELEELVKQLDGPAAAAVQAHIDRLNAIPRSINTALTFSDPRTGVQRSGQSNTRVHDGGLVTGGVQSFAGLRNDEVPAILQKGEMVLTQGQQSAVSDAMGGGITAEQWSILARSMAREFARTLQRERRAS
jgi:TP901 family phage tail tape measure protein